MQDEGFHEIQLNGKQLVFLFMAATVVSVVIFLLGVMVGRGVPAPRTTIAEAADTTPVDPTASVPPPAATPPAPAGDAPVSTQETLTYAERLEAPNPPPEELREEPVAAAALPAPAPKAPAVEVPATPADAAFTEPAGNGYVVQVAAFYTRAEATTVARSLSSKGYPTFVTTNGTGPKASYRVRVGKYNVRREAEAVARRLENEQQFTNSWITR